MAALLLGCAPKAERKEVRIYAASSLTEAFRAMERAFEREHPGVDVRIVFAGSQALRLQIEHGAPVAVFASADEGHAEALRAKGLLLEPQPFARNELALIVPKDNPAGLVTARDLPRAQRVVIGAATVPIGRYTERLLSTLGVTPKIVSREANVRLVRAKVELGEADAAIVYATDLSRKVLRLPTDASVSVRYFHGALKGAGPEARRWLDYVEAEGQSILARHGFLGPGPR